MAERRLGQRSKKRAERWKRHFERQKELHRQIREAGKDIFKSSNFDKTKGFIQHGNMTVNAHCMNVARYSLALSEKLHISCNRRELIRGALLHDYFLYDWHDKDHVSPHKLHGFYHPGIALKNASREYRLTPREKDIIKKHMWPLTVVPPMCREAWIVTTADKWCSLMETVKLHKGHGITRPNRFSQQTDTEKATEVEVILQEKRQTGKKAPEFGNNNGNSCNNKNTNNINTDNRNNLNTKNRNNLNADKINCGNCADIFNGKETQRQGAGC